MLRDSIQGRAWKFGANVSTDSIAPGRLIGLRANEPEYAKHVLEDTRPEFAQNVQKDDFIVADRNFGCGSSREIAPRIIKIAGVGAVLSKSFGRIFYRNAINNGMLIIECDTDQIEEGDELFIDVRNRLIKKVNDPDFVMSFALTEMEEKIISAGGLRAYSNNFESLEV